MLIKDMIKIFIVSCLTVLVITSCTATRDPNEVLSKQHANLVSQGNSVRYSDGYIDGCSSGRGVAGENIYEFKKNTNRFNQDKEYALGWQQGYDYCREQSLNKLQQINMQQKSDYYRNKNKKLQEERERMWDQLRK